MRILIAGLAAALAISAVASAEPVAERQDTFKQFGKSMKGMKRMLDGKDTFDAAGFKTFALALQSASKSQWDAIDARFPKGSTEGEKNEALPAIWEKWDEFKADAKKNREAVDALAAVAGSEDQAALKQALGEVGMTCKTCHESFKKD